MDALGDGPALAGGSNLLSPSPASSPPFRAEAATPAGPAPTPSNAGPLGFLGPSWQSPNLLGDIGGLRASLAQYGVTLLLTENAETFGNLTGGVRQGLELNGLTIATVQVDTQKAFGLSGGLFNVSGLQIWGGYLSQAYLRNLQSVSGIEAAAGVRLWELWYQQKFGETFDVKLGEQSLDQEFMVTPSSAVFINGAFGWPILPTADLPGGGPAYPLAGLGGRVRAQMTDTVTVLTGLFNGSPIPRNSPDTPQSNPYGVSFPLKTGVLAIAELQFSLPGAGGSAKPNDNSPLPGTYKIGAWYDSYRLADQQYDNRGLPLADLDSSGVPATHGGNLSIYGLMDQTVWRARDDPIRSLNFFVRPMFAPLQDRNLLSFSLDAGLAMHEPFVGRSDDILGLGMGVAQVSNGASGYDRRLQIHQPLVATPVRSAETFVEATYQIQVAPWWQVQPDVQYVINPGARIANPADPTQRIKNELVIGLRTNITF